MFSKSAELHDKVYFEFKDYQVEAQKISELLTNEKPSARKILDVACGTGEHAKILPDSQGFEVDGIDLDDKLLSFAQSKNPEGNFWCADMVDFDLEKSYDVVMCLFSSIGYVKTLDRVTSALERFKAHTNDGGLILVEPWFSPEELTPGKIFVNTAQTKELAVTRMGYSHVNDRISTLHFEYLIGTPGKIGHEIEKHELGLFTVDEMKQCFKDAGLLATFDEDGFSGRGLYKARKG
jgi:predicted TPR repeat methyltransferase